MRGDGRIKLRGRLYSIVYWLNGEEHTEPTGQTDEQEARKCLRLRMKEVHATEIGKGAFITPKMRKLTIRELCVPLRTYFENNRMASPQNLSYLRRVEQDFGDFRAVDLTMDDLETYKQKQRADGYADATVNRVLEMLRRAYNRAVSAKRFNQADVPTFELHHEDNTREGNFTEQQLADVLANLPDYLQDFTLWASQTGQRKGELSQLTFGMLDGDVLRIPGSICKNKKGRVLPLTEELKKILARRKAARQIERDGTVEVCDLIFHKDGQRLGQCQKEWIRAVKAANCPDRIFHDLRRFAVTNLVNAGIPQSIAMKVSGHKTQSMFARYNIELPEEVREAMEAVWEKRMQAKGAKVVSMAKRG
jgi:integrase